MAKTNNQNIIKYRMKPINRIKIGEERFATLENKKLMARAKFKRAVIKILTKLQAYHMFEKIKRNKLCIIPITKFVKDYKPLHTEVIQEPKYSIYEDSDELTENRNNNSMSSCEYGDSVDLSDDENAEMFGDQQPSNSPSKTKVLKDTDKLSNAPFSPTSQKAIAKSMVVIKTTPEHSMRDKKQDLLEPQPTNNLKRGMTQKDTQSSGKSKKKPEPPKKKPQHHTPKKEDKENENMFDNVDPDKLDWRQMFLQERMVGEP